MAAPARAPLPFPPAPPVDDAFAELSALMPLSQHATALALGGARLIGFMPRQEINGEERRCAIRAPHGAYLRVARGAGDGEWTVIADGEMPSAPECVFLLQVGGVALHLKATIRNAEKGTLVAACRGGELSCTRAVADGKAGTAEEEERWRVESSPLGGGAATFQDRYGNFLSADATGYVCSRAPRASIRQSFWLCAPGPEQARVDAYRAAVVVQQQPLPPPPEPASPLSSCEGEEAVAHVDEQLPPAARKAHAALRDAAAATERAAAALAQAETEAAAAERFAVAARERWAAAMIVMHDADAHEKALREAAQAAEAEDWVPVSVPPGA
jgi:hypothetical protein